MGAGSAIVSIEMANINLLGSNTSPDSGDLSKSQRHDRSHSTGTLGGSLGHSRKGSYWSDFSFAPHYVHNAQAVLTWRNLTVHSKRNPKKLLLNNVSGQVTGGFWAGTSASSLIQSQVSTTLPVMIWYAPVICRGGGAVMGPSGSGKSTLLNTLACRLTAGMWAEGDFHLNGRPYSQHDLKAMSGYVMQARKP